MCVCCCKGLNVPMLWLAVLRQAGRGNRESLYNTVLLIEIIWHRLKSQHYFEDRQKEKCRAPSAHVNSLFTASSSSLSFPEVSFQFFQVFDFQKMIFPCEFFFLI